MPDWSKRPAVAVLLASALFVSILTLRPAAGRVNPQIWTCVLCGERGSADLILNLVLFVPIGAALARLGVRPVIAGGIALLFSGFLEAAQSLVPGRMPTWRDVVLNAAGAGLGAVVARDLSRWLSSRLAPLIFAMAVSAVPGTILLTGWLLEPMVRRNSWYGQPSPRLPHLAPWEGRLDSVLIGGTSIPNGFLRSGPVVQHAVASRAAIVLSGVAALAPARLAGLLAIADDAYEEVLFVGQEGTDLIVRERRRASKFRFFEPEFRIVGLMGTAPAGTPFRLEVELGRTEVCATINGVRRCSSRFAASHAWTLLAWRRGFSARTQAALGAATMFLLCLPVGLFFGAARSRGSSRLGLVALALGAGGVIAACAAGALAFPSVLESVAAIAGVAAGGLSLRAIRASR